MIDRSMTALRTLRPDFDRNIFWFRDDLHQPYPISPMGMTTIQKHHAWGYHVASEQTQLPPSKGAHVKLYQGRVYVGYISEVSANLASLAAVDGDGLTTPQLLDYLMTSEGFNRRHWEIHFILMYPADTIYLAFEAFCKEHEVVEAAFVNMLKGFHSMSTQTDEGLWGLARAADEAGLRAPLMDTSPGTSG